MFLLKGRVTIIEISDWLLGAAFIGKQGVLLAEIQNIFLTYRT